MNDAPMLTGRFRWIPFPDPLRPEAGVLQYESDEPLDVQDRSDLLAAWHRAHGGISPIPRERALVPWRDRILRLGPNLWASAAAFKLIRVG